MVLEPDYREKAVTRLLSDLIMMKRQKDLWKNLPERLDKLCACYRLCEWPSEKLIDEINTLRKEVAQ